MRQSANNPMFKADGSLVIDKTNRDIDDSDNDDMDFEEAKLEEEDDREF